MNENFQIIKKIIINFAVKILKKFIVPILIIVILLGACVYYINIDDAVFVDDDMSNVPYAVSQYINGISIGNDGQLISSMTAQELWDILIENDSKVTNYLDGPEELKKLMNAELITQYVDTRSNPDEKIDWNSNELNDVNSNKLQGIVKLKRKDTNGNNSTLTYVDSETFQTYIDNYNETGSEEAKKIAMSHFTLEAITSMSNSLMFQSPITNGTVINIPTGFGSVHTYMGWQIISVVSSTQYKLREQAGMNFDSEGFGIINGRYVIACTTTFGNVGDYVDFYQEDGSIIPCIIGDIKNQNESDCNMWGHNNGHCIVEFIVNKDTWYNTNHGNPGTNQCHPEWNQNIVKAINGGSYFDNPDFGKDDVIQGDNTINNNSDKNQDSLENTMKWPTDSTTITSNFGLRTSPTVGASKDHRGIDIGVSEGTNVYACESGKVTTASNSASAGNWVVIDHGNGYISKYMHNSELKVSVGDVVEKGQVIALSGNTGISTGPHLHFQIEYEGSAVDPMSFKYDNQMGNGTVGVGNNVDTTGNNTNILGDFTTQYYAKVATWMEKTTTVESNDPDVSEVKDTYYCMTSTKVNYREMLESYTMPFNYLWALLVISEDKDFVLELADLVYNSEIEISIYDNLKIETDISIDTYTKKNKINTDVKVTVNYGHKAVNEYSSSMTKSYSEEKKNNYKVTQTIVTKTNTLEVSVSKADVWMLEYTQDYVLGKEESPTVSNKSNLDDIDYPETPNSIIKDDSYGYGANLLSEKLKTIDDNEYKYISGQIDSVENKVYNSLVNRTKETSNTITTKSYVESPGKTIEKIDKNAEKDNFVKILLKPEYKAVRVNIKEVTSWLFEILESNSSTSDMVDLTKYLLYKAFDTNYGIEKYDFEEYSSKDFSVISDTGASSIATGGKGTIGVYTATNGKKYNLYLQGNDAPWANADYGESHKMSLAGCGPTAAAIIASAYNAEITPETFRSKIVNLYGPGNHSSPQWIANAFKEILSNVKTEVGGTFDEEKIKNCLKNSGQVWLVVNGNKYASVSHCIALIDYKENSQGESMVYVAHGTANSRSYGWDTLSYISECYNPNGVLYVGGK